MRLRAASVRESHGNSGRRRQTRQREIPRGSVSRTPCREVSVTDSHALTSALLDTLARAEEAATKGPWEVFRAEDIMILDAVGVAVVDLVYTEEDDEAEARSADAELIALMRNALPALLASARRELARAEGQISCGDEQRIHTWEGGSPEEGDRCDCGSVMYAD